MRWRCGHGFLDPGTGSIGLLNGGNNTGSLNLGFGNDGGINVGLSNTCNYNLGLGNIGNLDVRLGNFGDTDIGWGNAGSTDIGFKLQGSDRIGVGPLSVDSATSEAATCFRRCCHSDRQVRGQRPITQACFDFREYLGPSAPTNLMIVDQLCRGPRPTD